MTSQTATIGSPVVSIRPLRSSDGAHIRRWMKDLELVRNTVLVPSPEHATGGVNSPEAVERYIHALLHDPRRLSFAICADGLHIGNVGLKEWDEDQPAGECFIEIGERNFRGRGLGARAMRLLLDCCWRQLDLHTVNLSVFEYNLPAISLYERLGFLHTGRMGWHWWEGQYHQVLGMELERGADAR